MTTFTGHERHFTFSHSRTPYTPLTRTSIDDESRHSHPYDTSLGQKRLGGVLLAWPVSPRWTGRSPIRVLCTHARKAHPERVFGRVRTRQPSLPPHGQPADVLHCTTPAGTPTAAVSWTRDRRVFSSNPFFFHQGRSSSSYRVVPCWERVGVGVGPPSLEGPTSSACVSRDVRVAVRPTEARPVHPG